MMLIGESSRRCNNNTSEMLANLLKCSIHYTVLLIVFYKVNDSRLSGDIRDQK